MADGAAKTVKRRPARAGGSPTTPDPIEIAMEAEAGDTAADSPARTLLVNQNRLVGWQIASERAGFALKVLTALAGVAVVSVLGLMAWHASQADGLVVEAFQVPADMAATGATGETVARDVLDRLSEVNAEARSLDMLRVTDAWSQGMKIQVAQTGVSLDEVQRTLHQALGHETYVSGEVLRTATGLRLKVRATGARAVVVEGPADQLPALAAQAADGLFAEARPILYAEVLLRRRDYAAAKPLLAQTLSRASDARTRSTALYLQGIVAEQERRLSDALALYTAATAAAPDRLRAAMGYMKLHDVHAQMGHADAVARNAEAAYRELQRAGPAGHSRLEWYRSIMLEARNDYLGAETAREALTGPDVVGRFAGGTLVSRYMDYLAALHRISDARRISASDSRKLRFLFVAEDWAGFLASVEATDDVLVPASQAHQAIALANLGRLPEARAVAWAAPSDCIDCLVARAIVMSREGDVAGSDRLFQSVISQAGGAAAWSQVMWAREALRQNRPDTALRILDAARRLAPRWADPLAWSGEALLAKGDAKGATAKFAAAVKLAPRWGRLHLKWGEALAKQGRVDEARAKWRAAATMDLTKAERTELARVFNQRTTGTSVMGRMRPSPCEPNADVP